MKTILVVIVFAMCGAWTRQTTIGTDFSYSDPYGNKITVTANLPGLLDTVFLKSNLTGLHFQKGPNETTLHFNFTITDIRATGHKKEFELRVLSAPQTKDISEILKYQGYSRYRMSVKETNGILHIETVDYLSGEI